MLEGYLLQFTEDKYCANGSPISGNITRKKKVTILYYIVEQK